MQYAAAHDYPGFVAKESTFRRSLNYPPFSVLANVLLSSEKMEEAAAWAAEIGRYWQQSTPAGVRVLGPAAAPISRLKRIYRFHFVLKAQHRAILGGHTAGNDPLRNANRDPQKKLDRGRRPNELLLRSVLPLLNPVRADLCPA